MIALLLLCVLAIPVPLTPERSQEFKADAIGAATGAVLGGLAGPVGAALGVGIGLFTQESTMRWSKHQAAKIKLEQANNERLAAANALANNGKNAAASALANDEFSTMDAWKDNIPGAAPKADNGFPLKDASLATLHAKIPTIYEKQKLILVRLLVITGKRCHCWFNRRNVRRSRRRRCARNFKRCPYRCRYKRRCQ